MLKKMTQTHAIICKPFSPLEDFFVIPHLAFLQPNTVKRYLLNLQSSVLPSLNKQCILLQ